MLPQMYKNCNRRLVIAASLARANLIDHIINGAEGMYVALEEDWERFTVAKPATVGAWAGVRGRGPCLLERGLLPLAAKAVPRVFHGAVLWLLLKREGGAVGARCCS